MKKALPLLALLLVLAAVIAFTMRRAGGVGASFPASRAAELAPAETIAFLQLPDLDRTRERWKTSELGALGREADWQTAEWQEALSGWAERTAKDYDLGPLIWMALNEVKTLEAAGFFLAVTKIDRRSAPEVVAGFSYRQRKGDFENSVRQEKERLFQAWAGAKSELSTHRGIEIETIGYTPPSPPSPASGKTPATVLPPASGWVTSPAAQSSKPGHPDLRAVHLAYRDNWLFVATSRALLAATLDRYLGQPGTPKSLAEDATFVECRKHEAPGADGVVWTRWEPFGETLLTGPLAALAKSESSAPGAVQALHYSGVLDGPRLRDRLYLHLANRPRAPAVPKVSLTLKEPDNYFRATVNFDRLRGHGERMHRAFWTSGEWDTLTAALAKAELPLDDLWLAFGPRISFVPTGRSSRPEYLAALEVRDAAKARKFFDLVQAAGPFEKHAGPISYRFWWPDPPAPRWSPSHLGPMFPPMALTKTHLLIGLTYPAVKRAAENAEAINLALQPATAGSGANADAEALVDFDARRFFDATKVWVQPNFAYVLRLPAGTKNIPFDALSRHLLPASFDARPADQGWLVEGYSTFGFMGTYLFVDWISGLISF